MSLLFPFKNAPFRRNAEERGKDWRRRVGDSCFAHWSIDEHELVGREQGLGQVGPYGRARGGGGDERLRPGELVGSWVAAEGDLVEARDLVRGIGGAGHVGTREQVFGRF